jgi:hypothetical protein
MNKYLDITKISFNENNFIKNNNFLNNKFSKIINNLYFIFNYLPKCDQRYIYDKYFTEFNNYEYLNIIFNYIFYMFHWRNLEKEEQLTKEDIIFIFEVKEKQYNLSNDEIIIFENILEKTINEINNFIIKK